MSEVRYIHRYGRRIEVETLDTGPLPKKRRQGLFVLIPEAWLRKLAAMSPNARWLAVVLLWKFFRQRGHAFACANLEEFGISKWQKSRGLVELERAGLILVSRNQHRSPRVEIQIKLGCKN
jgi:hypothetical protein